MLFICCILLAIAIRNCCSEKGDLNPFMLEFPGTVHRKMKVCDNLIVDDIPGKHQTVLSYGKQFIEEMHNQSIRPLPEFSGVWQWEVWRQLNERDYTVPPCASLKVFGDEKVNYDEAKRFCYYPTLNNRSDGNCLAYSIGGNNQWDFEENMFRQSNCNIETFDCTVNGSIPLAIQSRTRFHKICLGATESGDKQSYKYLTLPQINELVGRGRGPDYFKMDIEGYEWAVLKAMIHQTYSNPQLDNQLPQQIYAEFHLNMDSNPATNSHLRRGSKDGHVGARLRRFLNNMFLQGGYMIMFMRTAKFKANTDILFAKVFCTV